MDAMDASFAIFIALSILLRRFSDRYGRMASRSFLSFEVLASEPFMSPLIFNQMPLLGGSLSRLIPEKLGELETEDLLLILILYLMYRESGDKDLLIIMGAMYLL